MDVGGLKDLKALKAIVQAIEPATRMEHLIAALVGNLIGTSVAVARSGFQHGADAGTAGRQQRLLRIECKRYGDATSLDGRRLLGEIDHAYKADPALEAWILATTREVDEQLERDLFEKGQSLGIPVLVVDWKSHDTPALAALLASDPKLVASSLNRKAGALAARLLPHLTAAIDRLRRDLSAWHIGSTAMRRLASERLKAIWSNPRESQTHFGQVVSGGARHHIHRVQLLRQLDDWWASPPTPGAPVCVTGLFGVGKTWAVADWLIERADQLPATLLVPASALVGHSLGSVHDVKTFLAQRLHEVMGVRDVLHWRGRLARLLLRPEAEGPVLLVVLDGMSQQPQVPWEGLLKILQGAEFVGRVRVITTTRTLHFEVKLRRLASLVDRVVPIEVERYDALPEGELDQMLALHNLKRQDLHVDLHAQAQIPRLFELVIRFRDRLVDAGAVTLHRLLWEYGRDSAGAAENKVFSAHEWMDWLRVAAEKAKDGIQAYSLKDLGEMTARQDLEPSEVYQRVSELADSSFFRKLADGTLGLTPALVAHALGATVVHLLSANSEATREALESALEQWLDPISGLDQRPEILRAAVSIALEAGPPSPLLGVLTAAWLQTQNLAQSHQTEVRLLAAEMPDALLDAIELSNRYTHAASRHTAVVALRGVDRGNERVRSRIFARAAQWLSYVSRDLYTEATPEPEAEEFQRKRLLERVGVAKSGPLRLLGEPMVLVDRDDSGWTDHLPALIEGYPLAGAVPILRIAAIAAAVGFSHRAWGQLQWVFFLSPTDPREAAAAIRKAATEMAHRRPEAGVHPQLGLRAAELLLHISGEQADDEAAAALQVTMGRVICYETDYLPDPGRSAFYRLERRHAQAVLADDSLPLSARLEKCGELWLDPTFGPPPLLPQAVAAATRDYPVEKMYQGRYATREDIDFDDLEPSVARCAPQVLAALRRKIARTKPTTVGARLARAWHQNTALLLYGPEEAEAARVLRTSGRDTGETGESQAASELLLTELTGLDALAQAILVVEANLPGIRTSIAADLCPLTTEQADQLVERYRHAPPKQQRDVLVVLVTDPPQLSASVWHWIWGKVTSDDEIEARLALTALAAVDPAHLGTQLDQAGWSFSPEADSFSAHAASGALIAATHGQPFELIAARLAPWRLLEAVRARGDNAPEARIAIERLDAIVAGGPLEAPDPGAIVSVERPAGSSYPRWYSFRPAPAEDEGTLESLKRSFDEEAQREALLRAGETAHERIGKARKDGAVLFLQFLTPEDGRAILCHAPDVVDRWIAGYDTLSADFVRRVQLAEGMFLAVCEALLADAPATGVLVWKALERAVRTRITGGADLPELLHMLFRAPDSAPVLAARNDLLDLARTHTDADLYEVLLVAQLNSCDEWLDAAVTRDRTCEVPWRQQRAVVMEGFIAGNRLPVSGAWSEGESTTWTQQLQRSSARLQYLEACSHHWWQEFWRCDHLEQAYAAWVLFTHCADRRALCWMSNEATAIGSQIPIELRAAKQRHWELAGLEWKNGAESSKLSLRKRFLNRSIDAMVWPWRE